MNLHKQSKSGQGLQAIPRQLHGTACSSCGGVRFSLLFQVHAQTPEGALFARCSHCQTLRPINKKIFDSYK